MANRMSEVAKVLGVAFGECFEIYNKFGYYYLNSTGLHEASHLCSQSDFNKILCELLTGDCIIKHKPWKPIINDTYYFVRIDGDVGSAQWISNVWDHSIYKLGNCYRNREEAEANRDKWVAFYASDGVLEV